MCSITAATVKQKSATNQNQKTLCCRHVKASQSEVHAKNDYQFTKMILP